jgi:hypothetical protein
LAVLCMVLALAAASSSARADDPDPEYGKCGSNSLCNLTCSGSYPECGKGACTKTPSECDACACKPTADFRFCECQFKSEQ